MVDVSVARSLSTTRTHDYIAARERCRRGMCSLLNEAVETIFFNQNFDTKNHYCLIEFYVHETEGHYFIS